ncbi:MAG: hypothetical protein JNM84_24290 [Planctomycetes bacterium]|nr:hypothetical protein [Planctomycetota bacterium]
MNRMLAAACLAAAALFSVPTATAQQGLTGNWNFAVLAQAKIKDLGTYENLSLDRLRFTSATTFAIDLSIVPAFPITLTGNFTQFGKKVVFEIDGGSRELLRSALEVIANGLALASGNPPTANVRIEDLKLVVKYKNSTRSGEQIGMKAKARFVVNGIGGVSRKATFVLIGAGTPE